MPEDLSAAIAETADNSLETGSPDRQETPATPEVDSPATPDAAEEGDDVRAYTPEELGAMNPDEVDVRRLPPDYRKNWDRIVSKYTMTKAEENRQLRGELDQIRAQIAQANPAPPVNSEEGLYTQYRQNPLGTQREFEQFVNSRLADGDYEAAFKAQGMLQRFMGRRDIERETSVQEHSTSQAALDMVRRSIPDYNQDTANKLIDFARTDLGMDDETINFMSDPRFGKVAAQNIIACHKMYLSKEAVSKKALAGKEQRKPNATITPGVGAVGRTSNANLQMAEKAYKDDPSPETFRDVQLARRRSVQKA